MGFRKGSRLLGDLLELLELRRGQVGLLAMNAMGAGPETFTAVATGAPEVDLVVVNRPAFAGSVGAAPIGLRRGGF